MNTIINVINGGLDTSNFTALSTDLAAVATPTAWVAWSPSFGGFSANPTVTARYRQVGKDVVATMAEVSAGTSNGTSFTVTLPVAPKTSTILNVARVKDNGGYSATQGIIVLVANSTTATLYRDPTGTTWTSSNGKAADFTIPYEAQ